MSHACPDHEPGFRGQLAAGGPYGKYDCTAWSAVFAIDYATCGRTITTGQRIRSLSDEPIPDPRSPGLNLGQVDEVALRHFGVSLDTRYAYPWAEFARRIAAGEGAILQGEYEVIADSGFDAGRGFRGGHAIFVPHGWAALDPLADGRAAGVYRYAREAYPQSLLRAFAARLVLRRDSEGRVTRRVGDGYVYASFTRDVVATWRAYLPTVAFWVYAVTGGVVTGRTAVTRGGGSSVPVGSPRLHRWPGHTSRSLVRVTKGIYEGRYVSSSYAKEVG